MEEQVTLRSRDSSLYGVLHTPAESALSAATGVLFLHGWSGCRSGPHQMFTRTARDLCAHGIHCLRFDFWGRGESEGDLEQASLETMIEDVAAVGAQFAERCSLQHLVLLGICSGGEVATGAACAHEKIDGLVLWSAPIFSAGDVLEVKKKAEYAKGYVGKLFRRETWAKLFAGKLQFGMIARVLFGKRKVMAGEAGQSKNFRDEALASFRRFQGAILQVYGTNDPVTADASAWYDERVADMDVELQRHLVQGANHSYYGLAWEQEVLSTTREWLLARYGGP